MIPGIAKNQIAHHSRHFSEKCPVKQRIINIMYCNFIFTHLGIKFFDKRDIFLQWSCPTNSQ